MAAVRRQTRRYAGCARGFTLLEAMVALIMFGVITTALSLALSSALRSQADAQYHQAQSGAVRAVFDMLTRDIQSAYPSIYDPNSVFVVGGGQSGNGVNTSIGSVPSGLLLLSTLSQSIQTSDPNLNPAAAALSNSGSNTPSADSPQSECALVRYDLDTQSGTLSRTVVDVPSLADMPSGPVNQPQSMLAQNVVSLTFNCWDPNQQTWRNEWDYEQQLQSALNGSGASGQSGTTTQTSATNGQANATTNSSATGDTYLPAQIHVQLVIRNNDGTTEQYSTTIPIVTPTPLDANKATTTGQTGQNGGTSQGGTSQGGNSQGGTPRPPGGG